MPQNYWRDERVVLTLDAGGTNFRFFATCGNRTSSLTIMQPACDRGLDHYLESIVDGFKAARAGAPRPPVAISFGFPGPADYPNGVIGDLEHLPVFRGGVALGPMLEERFGLPVFINNDGDLFAYGEALAGFLPYVNLLLQKADSPKRYKNLVGITLGSGFGGGLVHDGRLFLGDNSLGAEVWLLRNKLRPQTYVEDGANIDSVRRTYSEHAGMDFDDAPEPKVIFEIAREQSRGDKVAALEAFHQLGEVVGDALANVLALVDGLAVIGGGLSNAWPVFSPALFQELNSEYTTASGRKRRRLIPEVFDLEDEPQRQRFLRSEPREVSVNGPFRKTKYDPFPRIGIGRSRLGTSEAVAIGAYCYALEQLDRAARQLN